MITCVYKLKFDTPVHFGAAELGGKLEAINFTYSSDALFSALCCELANSEIFSDFFNAVAQDKIFLSDLFPYNDKNFYLPKPLLNEKQIKYSALEEVRKQFTQRKKQKKMDYLRASNFQKYLASLKSGESFIESSDFGSTNLIQKVSCRDDESLPYYVGEFFFNATSGLYLIANFKDENYFDEFFNLLSNLGLSGIGGKRSSGLGKFHIIDKIILDESCANEDLKAVKEMLSNENASWQMCISSVLPAEEDISVLSQSYYRLKKRGGFVTALTGEVNRKKNSVYMLDAGSCLPKRIEGRNVILDKINDHEIFRFGKGFFVGLPI